MAPLYHYTGKVCKRERKETEEKGERDTPPSTHPSLEVGQLLPVENKHPHSPFRVDLPSLVEVAFLYGLQGHHHRLGPAHKQRSHAARSPYSVVHGSAFVATLVLG